MDVFTRRIIGFGIAPTSIDGMSVCRMFNCATREAADVVSAFVTARPVW
jgi:hypothetical protein